jgi:hypothetical protein
MKDSGAVFLTWKELEAASSLKLEDIDAAVDRRLPFKTAFHDFAVWNAQPTAYQPPVSTGLDDVRWQEQDRLDDFPEVQHHLTSGPRTLDLGKTTQTATIDALAAQYDAYQLADDAVRQIKIDVTSLKNAANADLDVLAQIRPSPETPGDHWRRIPGSSGVVQLCRDSPSDNVAYFHVIISNHAVARIGDDPDSRQLIEGQYTVEAKEKCEVPNHFDVTFSGSNLHGDETNSWSGTATFDRVEEGEGSEPGQYGYVLAKGTATWEYHREPHDPRPGASGHATVQLSRAARDFGTCELVTASEDPSRAMTLYCLVTAGEHPIEGTSDSTPEIAENEVYNWIYTNVQRYQAGFTLSGSERREGSNRGFQIWNWTFTPRFDT